MGADFSEVCLYKDGTKVTSITTDAFRRDKAKVGKLPALTGKRASSPKEKKVKKKETDDSDSSDNTEKKNSKEKMKNLLNKGKGLFNLLK